MKNKNCSRSKMTARLSSVNAYPIASSSLRNLSTSILVLSPGLSQTAAFVDLSQRWR